MKPASNATSGVAIAFAIVLSACADTPVAPTAPGASSSGTGVPQSPSRGRLGDRRRPTSTWRSFCAAKASATSSSASPMTTLSSSISTFGCATSHRTRATFCSGRWTPTSTTTARAQPGSLSARDFSRSPSRRTRPERGEKSCFARGRLPLVRSLTSTSGSSRRRPRRSC